MKKLLLGAAALAMIAGPVFAQTWVYPGKQPRGQPAPTQSVQPSKPAPAKPTANDVYWCDQYVGSDPDVNVRLQLLKDYIKKDCGSL